METIAEMFAILKLLLAVLFHGEPLEFARKFIPFVVFFELPIYIVIFVGVLKYYRRRALEGPQRLTFRPTVSCVALCYAEGDDVKTTISSLANQIYPGKIEILAMIDGASVNVDTHRAALEAAEMVGRMPNRTLRIIPKWQRGGRVSSLNAGLALARGEIIMALDGDTSFDNEMVINAVQHFEDPNVVGVSGNLRIRNVDDGVVTKLQSIEYLMSIYTSKVGLSEFNVVNNISGAFGVFRTKILRHLGGWDSGTAEDLDLTLRLKQYFGRYPNLRIVFEPNAMGHTDGPSTFKEFFQQRHRWDGDLFYLYCRKHIPGLRPRLLGWRNLLAVAWTGLFFQLVMPFIILIYSVYVFIVYPLPFVLGVWSLIYLFYLFVAIAFFGLGVTLLSERKREDLKLVWYLPLMPLFTFATRLWSAVATLDEVFRDIHLDSSMAPWWVLKKTKF